MAKTAAAGAQGTAGHVQGYGTPAYRTYVLNALLFIYILNFVDRGLLSVAAAPIKAELEIGDTGFGLLTGFGFALLYTIVGIPLARLAERRSRVKIMAASVVLWSLMTALCGLATDITIFGAVIGGFWILLLCRVGVGIGEAGCTPPANSLLADYYPPKERSSALGYYAMGVTLGTMLASLIGGPVTDWFGWRVAFFVLGLPGVLVGFVLLATVKEPPRGYTDPPDASRTERAALGPALREMLSKRSYWTMTAGATIAAFCGYGIASFQTLYLVRTFGVTTGQAAIWFNTPANLAGAIGTVCLGVLATRLQSRNKAAIAWLAAGGLALSVPFYLMAFLTGSMVLCVIGLSAGHFVKYGYLAAQYTIGQGVVSMRVRATATAVLLFVVNLFGYGLGPLFAGLVSDFWFGRSLRAEGFAGSVDRALCDAVQQAATAARQGAEVLSDDRIAQMLSTLPGQVSEAQYRFCLEANASSTEASMVTIACFYVIASAFFVWCATRLKKDLVAQ
ncbi:spinster family MFS transporter [Parvularcula oceani]|uniref:spinster family MFS transporter n=1 Tax=Parvularcula oceani TaxID=1247963 RepID=UPI0004E1DCBE|nr:MFS transporter [Parvularcula oceani]